MALEITMPKFGLTMLEGTIQQWHKGEGDRVTEGEILCEVETEKVLYEVESPGPGVVARILYPEAATVPVAGVMAVIAEPGEDAAEVGSRYQPAGRAPAAASPTGAGSPTPPASSELPGTGRQGGAPRTSPVASPAARKLAKEHDIDLGTIALGKRGGRISRADVEGALAQRRQSPPAAPLRGMRKVIATRMHRSLQVAAQLTITTETDVTAMVERRHVVQHEFGLTYTDLVVEATAKALGHHPRLNATVDGEAVRLHSDVHIGIAVALEEGLLVPVIRHADRKSLREIAGEAAQLAEKARSGALSVDDVGGGTFTISNLGAHGVDAFTPILNLPEVAILGMGRVREKPAVYEGAVTVRQLMTLSLTFDHRMVDGAPAAAFLQTIAQHLSERQPQG